MDGAVKRIQVWDTGGQEQFKAISKPYYRNADGALLIFDVLDPQTMDDLEDYLIDVRELCPLGVAIALIGNKADLRSSTRQCVSSAEGEKFARRHGVPLYLETSAVTGLCVDEAFAVLCQHAINNRRTQQHLRTLCPSEDSPAGSVSSRMTWRQSASARRSVERVESQTGVSPQIQPRPTNNFQRKTIEKRGSSCCK